MSIADKSRIEDVLDRVKEQEKVGRKLIKEQLGDQPYGHKAPNDTEFLLWWREKLKENPPVPVDGPPETVLEVAKVLAKQGIFPQVAMTPDGKGLSMTISLFHLALALAKNGNEWWSRYRAAVRRTTEREAAYMEVA